MTMPQLNAQNLMTLRDAAEALMYEFGAEDLGAELNEVGDKLTDLLKEQLDTEQNVSTKVTCSCGQAWADEPGHDSEIGEGR